MVAEWKGRRSWMLVVPLALGGVLACAAGRPLPEAPLLAEVPAAGAVAKDPGPARILLARWHYQLNENGTFKSTFTQKYEILDQRGVDGWAYVSADWHAWYLNRPVITAKVTSSAGVVSPLDPKMLSERPVYPDAPDVYGDGLVLHAPLPNVSVGSVVEETIVESSHRPFFAGGMTRDLWIPNGVRTDRLEIVIDAPKNLDVRVEIRGAQVKRTEKMHGNVRQIVLAGGPFEPLEPPEPLLPPEVNPWRGVSFSTGRSWQTVARAYSEVVDQHLEGIDFGTTVEKIVAAGDGALDRARKIHGWLKERVRYAAIEFGESSIIPRSPADTIGSGHGDCKDQATLLVGLLRAAGVDADVALLRSGTGLDVAPALTSLDVFNHAIVLVHTEPPLWIDPTADLVRVGALPVGDQNRLALVADPSTTSLVRIPAPTSATNVYDERRIVRLSELGPGNVREVTTGTGFHERQLRDQMSAPEAKHREALTDYVKSAYDAAELGELARSNPRDLSAAPELSLEAKMAGIAYTSPFDASATVGVGPLFTWLPDSLFGDDEKPRRNDLLLPVPYRATVTWQVHAPEGFEAVKVPNTTTTRLGPARLDIAARRLDGDVVELRHTLDIPPRMTPADVAAFRAAYKKWGDGPIPAVGFRHRAKGALDQGNIVEAVAGLRREIERQPKSALHRIRLGLALADLGFGVAGRREAKAAMALAPDDPLVHREVGHLLSRGDLGAFPGRGFERDAAIEAYRKAATLDPKDTYSQLRIGVLLEYDADAHRYGNKDLARACAHYDSLDAERVRTFDNGSFASNVLFCLLEAGQLDELARRVEAMPIDAVPSHPAVVGAALRGGRKAALEEVERLGLSKEARSEALAKAAQRLFWARRYDHAADLLEQSASGADATVQNTALVRAWRRMKPVDPRTLSPDSPEKVVLKILATVFAHPEEREAVVKQLVSPRAWNREGKSAVADMIEKWDISKTRAREVSAELLGDMAVHGYEAQTTGSDRLGYRVAVTLDYGAQMSRFQAFVVKEGGRYLLRAFKDDVGELAMEAFHAAQRGEVERAKQWLTWATEGWRAGEGDDPLRGWAFLPLWDDGKGDPTIAAAALAATSNHAASVIPALERALAKAPSREAGSAIQLALVQAHRRLEHYKEMLAASRRLLADHPESDIARGQVLAALWELGQFDEQVTILRAAMAKGEKAARTWRLRLAGTYAAQGKIEEARKIQQAVIAEGEPTAQLLNSYAWNALFTKPTEADLAIALRAVQMEKRSNASTLHTLACLQADLGRFGDARETLVAILALRPKGEPDVVDQYVIGRIAEGLGLAEAAKQAYRAIPKPEKREPTATYELAQRRLRRL